ncbi:BTB/POZ domain-containing protein 2-like [Folsomia candida]|uniref:BTB/POZ domain-containing protein 2-like n=1 Tax=Folsomia candida TaxID=158441 RepID=UPI00160522F4|nr:BTB/POZ domain-containing protein 2-like [Folsomia candida]
MSNTPLKSKNLPSFENSSSGYGGMLQPLWQWTGSHDDRLLNLLETGFQNDLTVTILPEGLKIPVHRIFLQAGSPILNDKIDVSMEELAIEDVDSHLFKMLLKFLYTGKSDVEICDAIQLMELATVYKINGLRDECANVLRTELALDNALCMLQTGMEYAHREFVQCTLKCICRYARIILKSDEFTKLRLECLIEIIKQDSLKVINEMEVFEAIYRWGIAECERQSLDHTNPVDLRKCLAEPLKHTRFPLMDPSEFVLKVATKNLLSSEEGMDVLTCILVLPENR